MTISSISNAQIAPINNYAVKASAPISSKIRSIAVNAKTHAKKMKSAQTAHAKSSLNPAEHARIKPAWETFALANRNLGNGWPACGFQYLPYIRMKRGSNASGMHWITTRQFPSGFNFERSWKILREPAENTKLVYECRVGGANGNHAMISPDPACEGQFNMGPLGYVYNTQVTGTSPIYRCRTSNGSHFVSPAANCEGQIQESLVGYAIQE